MAPGYNMGRTKQPVSPPLADVKEPPVFRGDGSDKFTVDDWQEMMEVYLQRRAVTLSEQHTAK